MYEDHIKCVERLLVRDAVSWDFVMRRYVPFLRLMALQTGLEVDEADESVQNTLKSLWEHNARALREYEGRASFKTYLARIAHRDFLDYLRQKKRHRRKVERKTVAHMLEGEKEIGELVDAKIDVELLLGNLDNRGKTLVKLLYYEGLTSEEAAAVFGTSASTVDVWHFRVREKLRKLVREGKTQRSENVGGQGGDTN